MKSILLFFVLIGLGASAQFQIPVNVRNVNKASLTGTTFSFDSDAQAFITATGITDSTYKMRINDLYTQWKDSLPYSSYPAFYPMVGTTNATQKYNGKDPRDLDAAYRLTYGGSVTSSSSGMDFSSSGYANTLFIPSTGFATNYFHIGVFINENTAAGDKEELGAYSSTGAIDVGVLARFTSDQFYPGMGSTQFPSVSSTSSIGYFCSNRISTNAANVEGFKNGLRVLNSAQVAGRTTSSLTIGARNTDSGQNRFSDRRVAFVVIGPALTEAQMLIEYRIIQRFRTAIGGGF